MRQTRRTRVARVQMQVHAADAAWSTSRSITAGNLWEQQSLTQALTAISDRGAGGGAAMADFDTQINLIESTV